MMSVLRIKDWQRFQHFKDRRPPWIKLYRDILDDPDWHNLDGESAKILTMLWLIASEDETHQGTLPPPRNLSFRLRISEKQLKLYISKLSHWLIQDDITMISGRYQVDTPEGETERETEGEERSDRPQVVSPDDVTLLDVNDWVKEHIKVPVNFEREILKFKNHDWKRRKPKDGVKALKNWLLRAAEYHERDYPRQKPREVLG